MPRDLGDVLHYFIPEVTAREERVSTRAVRRSESEGGGGATNERDDSRRFARPALPIVTLPIEQGDVLRAAFAWNLAVEAARLGASATVVAPRQSDSGAWARPGRGPLGAKLVLAEVENAAGLLRAASGEDPKSPETPGIVFVCAPRSWLCGADAPAELLRWILLLCSPDAEELREAHLHAIDLTRGRDVARVGVTIHGVRRIAEAEMAFEQLVRANESDPGSHYELTSYGLLVDDLHVYRAIVAQRPIGLAHPQSPAARALRDVARLLLDDAKRVADA